MQEGSVIKETRRRMDFHITGSYRKLASIVIQRYSNINETRYRALDHDNVAIMLASMRENVPFDRCAQTKI